VAHGGAHTIVIAEILADGLRLGRRLDDDQSLVLVGREIDFAGATEASATLAGLFAVTMADGRAAMAFLTGAFAFAMAGARRTMPFFAGAAFFAAGFFFAGTFFFVATLMHRHVVAAEAVVDEADALHERAKIIERDAALDLRERALDERLQLVGAHETGAGERHQVPPRFGSESSPFVGTQHSESHAASTSGGRKSGSSRSKDWTPHAARRNRNIAHRSTAWRPGGL
jgi:hypothetical protein